MGFSTRLQPAANDDQPVATTHEAPVDTPPVPPATKVSDDTSPAVTPASTGTSSRAGANPDALLGLLETFLTEQQSQGNPATAYGSFACTHIDLGLLARLLRLLSSCSTLTSRLCSCR